MRSVSTDANNAGKQPIIEQWMLLNVPRFTKNANQPEFEPNSVMEVLGNKWIEEMVADVALLHIYRGLLLALRSVSTGNEQLRFYPRTSGDR